jgi:4-amino-4-deoxy-L-arabinose transferase-like glycosyltransferase
MSIISSFRDRISGRYLVFALALGGALVIVYATRWGPWAYSDSTAYIVAARNLAHGQGLGIPTPGGGFAPTAGHPPLYQLILAFLTFTGADTTDAARWLDVGAYAAGILALGLGMLRFGWPTWLALLGTLTLFLHDILLHIYTGAMTEPLFTTLTLAGVVAITLYLTEQSRIFWAELGMAALGLAFVTRYSGLASIGAAAAALLLLSPGNLRRRSLRVASLTSLACIPIVIWMARLAIDPAANAQKFSWSMGTLTESLQALRLGVVQVAWSWLPFVGHLPELHYRVQLLTIGIVALVLCAPGIAYLARKGSTLAATGDRAIRSSLALAILAILSGIGQIVVFGIAIAFSNVKPDLSPRTLSPLLIFGLILFSADLGLLAKVGPRPRMTTGFGALVLCLITLSTLPQSVGFVEQMHQGGQGYTSRKWRQSELLGEVNKLPPSLDLVSNDPVAILFWTGRAAHPLPLLEDPVGRIDRISPFGSSPSDALESQFRQGKVALILFDSLSNQLASFIGSAASAAVDRYTNGLVKYVSSSDGAIYFWSGSEPQR